jgi:hypothetical protein
MTEMTCTVTVAVGATCGAPAVATFTGAMTGETFAECREHAAPAGVAGHVVAEVFAARICRKAICVELAMGPERVAHVAGACG